MMDLVVDREKLKAYKPTGIKVRAKRMVGRRNLDALPLYTWGNYDIITLEFSSLLSWLRADINRSESVVLTLLGLWGSDE